MKTVIARLALVPALIFWTLPALAQEINGREFNPHYDMGFGYMLFGGLMMIGFWAGLIILIVLAVRWLIGSARDDRPAASRGALDILQERYARGELDHDEFERRKQMLTD